MNPCLQDMDCKMHKPLDKEEIISVLMESPLYWEVPLAERESLIQRLALTHEKQAVKSFFDNPGTGYEQWI